MARKIQLSISEPCHENWDAMSQAEKGRFCGSCQKQVIDFSNMSDREIAVFFKKPSTGSVCGRFMTDQLEREIEIPKKRIPWFKYFFTFFLPAMLLSLRGSAQLKMGKGSPRALRDTISKPDEHILMGDIEYTCIKPVTNTAIIPVKGEIAVISNETLTGKVVDENDQPVPWASIETGKIGAGTVADKNGIFIVSQDILDYNGQIFVSSAGFERKAVPVRSFYNTKNTFSVKLQSTGWMPEVIVTALNQVCEHRRVTMGAVVFIQGDTLLTRVTSNDTINNTQLPDRLPGFRVFPNPVQAGDILNIETRNFESGYYQFSVFALSGQLIRQSDVWIDNKSSAIRLPVPTTASGSYFIIMQNRITGKKYSEKIIIL